MRTLARAPTHPPTHPPGTTGVLSLNGRLVGNPPVPWPPGGTLQDLLDKWTRIPESVTRFYATEIALALKSNPSPYPLLLPSFPPLPPDPMAVPLPGVYQEGGGGRSVSGL